MDSKAQISHIIQPQELIVKNLGYQLDYQAVWKAMRDYTLSRNPESQDQIWFVEHAPVFTQGQAGRPEHVLLPGEIPIVQTDRGGQVTYHGPGQLVAYFLLDIRRLGLTVRSLVCEIEKTVISLLRKEYKIDANLREKAPGVYVDGEKICSIGLRIRKGCSYHGIALNVDIDLEPFSCINPCGYEGMKVTQIKHFEETATLSETREKFLKYFLINFNYKEAKILDTLCE